MVPLRGRIQALLTVLVVAWALPAWAADARLSGVVRDSQGAGVPGATVVITNQATHATQTVVTGADGSFAATVPAGAYTVAVSLKGFGRQSKKDSEVGAPRAPGHLPAQRRGGEGGTGTA